MFQVIGIQDIQQHAQAITIDEQVYTWYVKGIKQNVPKYNYTTVVGRFEWPSPTVWPFLTAVPIHHHELTSLSAKENQPGDSNGHPQVLSKSGLVT